MNIIKPSTSNDTTFVTVDNDQIYLDNGTYNVSVSCDSYPLTNCDIEFIDSPNGNIFFKSGSNYFTSGDNGILRSLTEFEKEFYGF